MAGGLLCHACQRLLSWMIVALTLTALRILQPQDAYGLEKLASEELARHYDNDFGIECRIARFHNIYGPYGTWKGGREKAPAAFCRKVRTLHTLRPMLLLFSDECSIVRIYV